MDDPVAALIDELAANAIGSSVVEPLDGWLLRRDPDLPFRRCNAVLPFGPAAPEASLDLRIDRAEAFYRQARLDPRFQLLAGHRPPGLDAVLAGRGYAVEAPVTVMAGPCPSPAPRRRSGVEARLVARADATWLADYAGAFGDDGTAGRRAAAFTLVARRLGAHGIVAVVECDGVASGFGLGAVERGWVGLFGLACRPAARHRGVASTALHVLTSWGGARGASGAYLQVEDDNEAARALFRRHGFLPQHGYHYRTLTGPTR